MSNVLNEASLVLIPSGYKSGKVYSQIPENGNGDLDFTRSNDTATRVNSAGLIEKVRTNLALRSQDFANGTWVKSGGVTLTAGQTDPNGGTTAFLATATAIASSYFYQANTTAGCASIYAKAGTRSKFSIINGLFAQGAEFDLAAQTTIVSGAGSLAKIESVGGGWFRCSVYLSSVTEVIIALDEVFGGGVTIGQTMSFAFAQHETGDIATDYIPTTTTAVSVGMTANVPRLDYSGGGCPKLLLEPQRTNLALYSEQFDNAAWTKRNSTISANSATSPDGYTNADKIQEDTSNDRHDIYQDFSCTSGTSYTISAFVKAAERTFCFLSFGSSNISADNAFFNLSTGAVVSSPAGVTSTITSYGNGWYRITSSATAVGTGLAYVVSGPTLNASGISYQGVSGSGILVYGYSAEAGAYATSYIPTLSAASTRGQDSCSKTGISSLIGQTEGTMFAEFTIPETQSPSFFSISDGTSANRIIFGYYLGVLRYYTSSTTGSFNSAGIIDAAPVVGQTYKIAIGYKANDFKVYKNGSNTNTETTYTVPASLTALDNEGGNAGQNIYAGVKQLLLFPTRLSNTQLAELTTI